jgi:hypothetical protein
MLEGGISYLIIVEKLMQNWGYVYSILLDFLDNSILIGKYKRISTQ